MRPPDRASHCGVKATAVCWDGALPASCDGGSTNVQLKSGTSEAKTTIELEQAGMAPRSQPALLIRQLHSRYRAWCCPHDVATASKTAGHGPKLGVQFTS